MEQSKKSSPRTAVLVFCTCFLPICFLHCRGGKSLHNPRVFGEYFGSDSQQCCIGGRPATQRRWRATIPASSGVERPVGTQPDRGMAWSILLIGTKEAKAIEFEHSKVTLTFQRKDLATVRYGGIHRYNNVGKRRAAPAQSAVVLPLLSLCC